MTKSGKIYRVRNSFHEVEGEYSERQLLSRIKMGKYTGNEEVSTEPFHSWRKLSADPSFFDAFLNRILGNADVSSAQEEEKTRAAPQEKHSLVEKGTKQEGAKTEHILEKELSPEVKAGDEEEGLKAGVTIHKSDIDKLFENSKSRTLGKDEPSQAPQSLHFKEESNPNISLSQPLDHSPPPNKGMIRELQRPERRRTVLLGLVLVGLLAILFHSGKEEGSTENSTASLKGEPSAPVSPETRKEILDALIEEATSFYLSDTPVFYQGAKELMSEALHYEEKNVRVLGILTLANANLIESKKNATEEIVKETARAIELGREVEPHNSNFYRAEAKMFLYQGHSDQAKEKLSAATEADPTDPENSLLLAEIQIKEKDFGSAQASLKETLRLSKNSVRAHHLNAFVAFQSGQLELAKNEAGETARLNPLHADSYCLVGDILSSNDQLKEAKVFYELATKLAQFGTPSVISRAHFRLGNLKEIWGDKEAANKHYILSKHYSPQPSKEVEEKVASLSFSEKEVQEAIFETQYDRTYYQDRAKELLRENRHAEALRFYQAVRLIYPNDSMAMVRVGETMERLATSYEDFRRIMLLYQRAIDREPGNPKPYVKLALLETEQYNFTAALKLLTRALAITKEDADVYIALGKHFYKRQDYIRARDYLSKAANINPTDAEIYYYYGLLTRLYKKDYLKEATHLFFQSYTLDPQNYDALVEWLKLKVQNYEKNFAIKFVRNLIEKDAQNAHLHWAFGEIYAENREYRKAIMYYHKALDFDNRLSKVRMSLARALVAIGERESAGDEFRLASRLDRRNGEGFYEAAQLLLEMKRFEPAREMVKQLVETTPQYPGAHRLFSRVYQAQGKKDLAIEEMQKEVDNNPLNYKFTLEFAELYMGYEKYDKAISELEKVTSLPSEVKAPEFKLERIRAYLLLARSLRAQSKSDSAEGAIKTALSIDPNDPELHREMGYIYHSLQRDREATEAFKYYLSRNPAATDALTIKSLIQRMGTED